MEAWSISRHGRAGLVGVSALALAITIVSRLDGQGIRLEGDDWSLYTTAQEMPADADQRCIDRNAPGSPYSFICDTDDGVPFLALLGRCPTVTYTLNVSQLPAGKTSFPVEIAMRRIGFVGSGIVNVRNLTTDTYLSMEVIFGAGNATFQDSLGAFETISFEPAGELPGGDNVFQSTDPTEGRAPSTIRTLTAMLDLVEGENVIRLDSCLPRADGDHGQLFLLWIGPDETELQGTFAVDCAVTRAIQPQTHVRGEPVRVSLMLNNLPPGTTVSETFPSSMTVIDDGGGTVAGDTITFTPSEGTASVTYVLESGDTCDLEEFSGTYAGAAGCAGAVDGIVQALCVGDAGIRIEGGDWVKIATSTPPLEGDPCSGQITACTTVDGVDYLHTATNPVRLFDVVYFLDVQKLPGDAESGRYPVAIKARRICSGCAEGVFGIRNATTSSWIGFKLGPSSGSCGSDTGAETLLSGCQNTPAATDSTNPAEGGVAPATALSSQSTLALNRGMNEIHIENFGAGGQGSDDGDVLQVFLIAIGPSETDIVGRICAKTEEQEESCSDDLDNDCDGLVDAEDPDCACVKTEDPEATCDDDADNDCDGLVDAEDSDCTPSGPVFHRGDPNDDGTINITDGIYILNFLFLGGPAPTCAEAGNPNDDDTVNITDGIFVLNFLFLGGPPPAAPGGPPAACGEDPAESRSALGCASYTKC